MAYENIVIQVFMDAWFKQDYSKVTKDEFDIAYTEYIDTTGVFETREFELVTYIHYIDNRINSVKLAITLHKDFLKEFDVPFESELGFFKKFGHTVKWDGDKAKFLKALHKIESSEKKYITILNKSKKDLIEERKKRNKGEAPDIKETRTDFVRLLNSLGKCGYKIDKKETTVEELALMIKQQKEEQESLKSI